MHRPVWETFCFTLNPLRTRIDYYYLSKHPVVCGELVNASTIYASNVPKNKPRLLLEKLQSWGERCNILLLGGVWLVESGVKCISLACLDVAANPSSRPKMNGQVVLNYLKKACSRLPDAICCKITFCCLHVQELQITYVCSHTYLSLMSKSKDCFVVL